MGKYRKVCAVFGCTSIPFSDIKMYSFPKDTEYRKKWEHFCSRGDGLPKRPWICTNHFSDTQRKCCLKQSSQTTQYGKF